MSAQSCDFNLKIILVGDSGVGKTSLIIRFIEDKFEPEETTATIGIDHRTKVVQRGGNSYKMTICDTAGQEKFRSMTSSWYRATHGVILVFDVTRKESLQHIDSWLDEVELYSTREDITKLLVGNKIDCVDREISREEASSFARDRGMLFIEGSAKTAEGVDQAFDELLQQIIDSLAKTRASARPTPIQGDQVSLGSYSEQDTGCGC